MKGSTSKTSNWEFVTRIRVLDVERIHRIKEVPCTNDTKSNRVLELC